MVAGVLVSVTVTLMVTPLASPTGLGGTRTVVRGTSGFWRFRSAQAAIRQQGRSGIGSGRGGRKADGLDTGATGD
jgi:hypothetical protein